MATDRDRQPGQGEAVSAKSKTRKTKAKKKTRKAAAKVEAAPRAVFEPGLIREALYSKRFLAADRASLDLGEIATWDKHLLREHRLLVPIDVQALYVAPGSTERMVRLPLL